MALIIKFLYYIYEEVIGVSTNRLINIHLSERECTGHITKFAFRVCEKPRKNLNVRIALSLIIKNKNPRKQDRV